MEKREKEKKLFALVCVTPAAGDVTVPKPGDIHIDLR